MKNFTVLAVCTLVAASVSAVALEPAKRPALSSMLPASHQKCMKAPDADEIVYDTPEGAEGLLSRNCDGFSVEAFEVSHERLVGSVVKTVTDSEGNVWLGNIVSGYPVESWVKATRSGDKVTIQGPQPIFEEWDDNDDLVIVYLVPMRLVVDSDQQGTFVPTDDMRYDFNVGADGTLTASDPEMLLGVCTYGMTSTEGEYGYRWAGPGDRDVKLSPVTATPVDIPDGAAVEKWAWIDSYDTGFVDVCVNGDDFYISGMCRTLPDAWIKGKIEEGKVIFPSAQYLGPDMEIQYFCFFYGAEFFYEEDPDWGELVLKAKFADNAEFTYDAEKKILQSVNGYFINSAAGELYPLYAYESVKVEKQNRNPETVPAAPYDLVFTPGDYDSTVWVQVPNVDEDGNLLDVDKLYYELIVNGEPFVFDPETYIDFYEPTSRIPYNTNGYDIYSAGTDKTVYLYREGINSVGVRSVYINENGDALYSKAVEWVDSSVEETVASKTVKHMEWHDLTGRAIDRPLKGIVIRTVHYTDGSVRSDKVVLK